MGIAVGQDGRLFVTSLYMTGNAVSPYCASDLVMVTRADDTDEHPFAAYDLPRVPADGLAAELSSPSWQRRERAHQELLRRGGADLGKAVDQLAALPAADPSPAKAHLPWLLLAADPQRAVRPLAALAGGAADRAAGPDVRGKHWPPWPRPRRTTRPAQAALAGSDPRQQLVALAAIADRPGALPFDAVASLARGNDWYLRQIACRALALRGTLQQCESLLASNEAATRLAGVLALGMRLTEPAAADEPPAELPLFFPGENPFFKTRLTFFGGGPAVELAGLGRIGSYTAAERWAKVAHSADQERCAEPSARCT